MPEPIHCPDCKQYIGEDVLVDGLHLLQIGGVLLWDARLCCPQCGRMMYWSVRDTAIQAAIKKIKGENHANTNTSTG